MKKESLLAPWLADIYYNLGVVQEKAEEREDAINSFNLYLFAKPHAKDRTKVLEKIGSLKYEAKKNDFDGAVFTYVETYPGDPDVTSFFKIKGDEVTSFGKITTAGPRFGETTEATSVGHLSGKWIQFPPITVQSIPPHVMTPYYVISPDGQSLHSVTKPEKQYLARVFTKEHLLSKKSSFDLLVK